jgi:hypothetical protein
MFEILRKLNVRDVVIGRLRLLTGPWYVNSTRTAVSSSRASDLPVASHRQVKRGMNGGEMVSLSIHEFSRFVSGHDFQSCRKQPSIDGL